MELSSKEKEILLSAARESIKSQFGKADIPSVDYKLYPHLKLKAGEDVRIYGLPYKVLSVGPGNKLKIENKDYSKV